MKNFLLFVYFLHLLSNVSAQRLNGVLDGYSISKLPSARPIVGSKWVKDLGATTVGLPDDKLIVANSLDQFSLSQENKHALDLAVLSFFGLSGSWTSNLTINYSSLEIVTLKNLYELPLVKGETILFSAARVSSFDLIYDKAIGAQIKAKILIENVNIDADVDLGNKRKLSMKGKNLFAALKVIKINRIDSKVDTKKFREKFEIQDLNGYDLHFNVREMVSQAEQLTINQIGLQNFNDLKLADTYIQKYSTLTNIKVNVISQGNGELNSGMFTKEIQFCYCSLYGIGSNNPILLNTVNSGDKVTFDYFFVDRLWIEDKNLFMRSTGSERNMRIVL